MTPQSANLEPVSQPRRIRVGVADDHPLFLDGLCRLLSLEDDIDVVARATDGAQALHIVREHKLDVLLLDLQMPMLDGIDTLRQLQSMKSRTRVVLLTASEDRDRFVEAVRCGSAGVVSKQTATDLLVKSIRKVHQGEVWLDGDTTAAVLRQFQKPEPIVSRPKPESAKVPNAAPARSAQSLTPREREVVQLLIQGLRNRDIADRLFLSEQTVKNHLNSIFGKLQVSDRLELALFAIHNGLHSLQ